MTLHLIRASRRYVLQVSDRLVSGAVRDPLANKNLIYWARGAIVSIGYTGLAYGLSLSDRNIPTDEWIAELLWGKAFPISGDGIRPVAFGQAKIGRWLDIGQSIELLRCELQDSVDRLPLSSRKHPFELVAVGWQETRRRGQHPIFVRIVKSRGDASFVIERPQRDWHLDGRLRLNATPDGYVSKTELSNLIRELSTALPDKSEALLVETIRRVAARNPESVGPHCMSVLLPPLGVAPIRIRFIPETPHIAVFRKEEQRTEIPVAFSPWIIGPDMFCAPSVQVGRSDVHMGSFEIVIEAPAPEKGTVSLMASLARPKGP